MRYVGETPFAQIAKQQIFTDSGHGQTDLMARHQRLGRQITTGQAGMLWPHLDEFIDKTVKFIKREQAIPDVVHGHYPDAGYVAMELSRFFGVPFIFTGHSLGRVKKQKLLSDGVRAVDLERRYKIDHRIAVEEEVLSQADLIVTSTRQEIEEQYGLYSNNARPEFKVIPPGLDVERFYPYYRDMLPQNEKDEAAMFARASVIQELNRFFLHPDKPLILALCRPDKRKNITGLVRAYGEDLDLQAMANLAVFAGIRKDIESMESNEREVLTDMLLRLDQYDLYGKMAIPKKHDFEHEVPELYRIAAESRIDLAEFRRLGFNSVRAELVWSQTEVSRDVYDWERADFLIGTAAELGLRLFLVIGFQYPPDSSIRARSRDV